MAGIRIFDLEYIPIYKAKICFHRVQFLSVRLRLTIFWCQKIDQKMEKQNLPTPRDDLFAVFTVNYISQIMTSWWALVTAIRLFDLKWLKIYV